MTSGIVFVIRNGLRWLMRRVTTGRRSTTGSCGGVGVFNKIFAELARKAGKSDRLMIDATHLKAHRTAASLRKKGLFPDVSGARLELETACHMRWPGTAADHAAQRGADERLQRRGFEQIALPMPCLWCDDRNFAARDSVMKFF